MTVSIRARRYMEGVLCIIAKAIISQDVGIGKTGYDDIERFAEFRGSVLY